VYWAAAVGVEDHPGRGVAGGDRVGQGVRDQFGAQVISQREPDDAAGGDIDHGRDYVESEMSGFTRSCLDRRQ